ncbi:MAG: CHAT domain-containing protein [Ardenticatenaceae bacterium]
MRLNQEMTLSLPIQPHHFSPLHVNGESGALSVRDDRDDEEFRIEFHRAQDDDHYMVKASSALGTVLEHQFRLPFSHQELLPLLKRLGENRSSLMGRVRPNARGSVMDVGTRLFYALCEGPIGAHYERSRVEARERGLSLRIRLVMDSPELALLPWEFLYDEARVDFVGLSMHSPLVRQWGHPSASSGTDPSASSGTDPSASSGSDQLEPIVPPLRMLVVTADVLLQSESQKEVQALRALQAEFSNLCELDVVSDVTPKKLFTALEDKSYHVLLFIGHGHEVMPSRNSWISSEPEVQTLALIPQQEQSPRRRPTWEPVRAGELRDILRHKKDLRLVHFNGPYTDWLARELTSVAPATIGMRGPATENACLAFSKGFYRALLSCLPLPAAVTQGRQKVDHHRAGTREWSHIVFYMQSEHGLLLPRHSSEVCPITFDTSPSELEILEDSGAQEEWQLLNMRLAMQKRNLQALQERHAKYQDQETIPEFLLRQQKQAQKRIDQINTQMLDFSRRTEREASHRF